MRILLLVLFFSITLLTCSIIATAETSQQQVVNVILIGATGNLAQKYLWQAFFNIYQSNKDKKVVIWPGATKDYSISNPLLSSILKDNITSSDDLLKGKFIQERVGKYHQLKSSDDFQILANSLKEKITKDGDEEIGRLFYLSVPPHTYGDIAKAINTHLRFGPESNKAWIKVIVEKPFGVDLTSAAELAKNLEDTLQESEILLVDHYMGKPTLAIIREFRTLNPQFENMLNRHYVREVQISMVETEDVKGRTSFYDEVGVIRDTMQNHLMMMMSLLTMDLNTPSEAESRAEIVSNIPAANLESVELVAQYKSYNEHVEEERLKWKQAPLEKPSFTPTYARIVLGIDNDRWQGVRFVFTSGKALYQRRAFIRVIFSDEDELIFNIQGKLNNADGASIVYFGRDHLPEIKLTSSSWVKKSSNNWKSTSSMSAYESLLRDVLEGREESFVRLPEVLESWRVWTPLLDLLQRNPEIVQYYDHGGVGLSGDSLNSPPLKRESDEL